jgi:hypothetical protein
MNISRGSARLINELRHHLVRQPSDSCNPSARKAIFAKLEMKGMDRSRCEKIRAGTAEVFPARLVLNHSRIRR